MTKRLERKSNKMLFGIAAGLADYFGLDVTIVRLILVALLCLDSTGIVFLTYIAAIWLMPKAWDFSAEAPAPSPKEEAANQAA